MKSICPNCCGSRIEVFQTSDSHDDENCIPCRMCDGVGTIDLKEDENASEAFTKWEKTHFTHCIASFD
jgi:hypothetical protein